jgi:uncharacterized protein DUF3761
MRHLASSFFVALGLSLALAGAPAAKTSTVTCTDGTTSKAGKGACSHHGGVAASNAAPETAEKPAKGGTVTCKDGTTSNAGRGACSHHGGVGSADAATPPPAAAPSETAGTPAKKSSGGTKTAGAATAKCKDGTVSHSAHHQGACSHHGGVAEWLD